MKNKRLWGAGAALAGLLGVGAWLELREPSLENVGHCAAGPHGDWMQDFDAALAKARATGKPILANFAGSDWCPPCQAMEKDVFGKADFKERVGNKYVLLNVDFPNDAPQSDCIKRQNRVLAGHYEIKAFPTVVILGPKGEDKGGMEGYSGPRDFYANLRKLEEQKAR